MLLSYVMLAITSTIATFVAVVLVVHPPATLLLVEWAAATTVLITAIVAVYEYSDTLIRELL